MESSGETRAVDLREIGTALRHGWFLILVGAAVGLGLGFAVTQLVSEQYQGEAKVLVRTSPDLASSALSQLGGLGEILGSGAALESELETEIEILASRVVIGAVVDSLLLQAVVKRPSGIPPSQIFERVTIQEGTSAHRYEFERSANEFIVTGEGFRAEAAPGGTVSLPGGEVVLKAGDLPDHFTVDLLDPIDAAAAVKKSLRTSSLTSDIAEIRYRAGDPFTASEVPNRLVGEYLKRRRTTDRGTNQYRYDFLVGHVDSISSELANSEAALREYQERSGILDPQVAGETQLIRAMELQGELETIDVESRALQRIVSAEEVGAAAVRELAAFPTFLSNAAINDVLARLLELETQRFELSQSRTERDPDMIALSEAIAHLEGQLRSLSVAYISGLAQQRQGFVAELAQYRGVLDQLPLQEQEIFRRRREVERLSETQIALSTQLVQARLAAIGEGGEVRQVEAAVPPKKPSFPSDGFVLLLGLFGGIFFGTIGAVSSGLMRQRVREPWEVELATGIRATKLGASGPLAFPETKTARSILLVPMFSVSDARSVGERIVETANMQSRNAVLVDLTSRELPSANGRPTVPSVGGNGASGRSEVIVDIPSGSFALPIYHGERHESGSSRSALLTRLEDQFSLVVAIVPALDDPETLSLLTPDRPSVLVADSRRTNRTSLQKAVSTIERFGGRMAGVVLLPASRDQRR